MTKLALFMSLLSTMQGISNDYWAERGQPDHCGGNPPQVQFMTFLELATARGDKTPIAAADGSNCSMRFALDEISGRSYFCWVYIHEDGHAVRNLPHSNNKWSVMDPNGGVMPKVCLTNFVPARVRFMRLHGWECVPRPSFAAFNCHNNKNTYIQVDAI